MSKAAAMAGNTAMAGAGAGGAGLFDDMEAAIKQIRDDLDAHKDQYGKDLDRLRDSINDKASKEDLNELEQRMMQRLQDMFDQLRNMFPDKDALKKKLSAIEKNVSLIMLNPISPFLTLSDPTHRSKTSTTC